MARTYSEVPEPRYVERAKFADNGGGGGDEHPVEVVKFTLNPGFTNATSDHTVKEIRDAIAAGKMITGVAYSPNGDYINNLTYYAIFGNDFYFVQYGYVDNDGTIPGMILSTFSLGSSNTNKTATISNAKFQLTEYTG